MVNNGHSIRAFRLRAYDQLTFVFPHTVVLNDMKFEHLRQLVEYIYCGKTKLNVSELDEFFLACKRYKILGLNESSANESSASNGQHSMVYELPSGDDNNGDDKSEHNQTGQPNQQGTQQNKRKIDKNSNESFLQLASRKSMPNVSKRAHVMPQQQQPIIGNGQPLSTPANTPTTSMATASDPTKGTTPSNTKSANGKWTDLAFRCSRNLFEYCFAQVNRIMALKPKMAAATWQRMDQPAQRVASTSARRSVAEKHLPHHKNCCATASTNVPNAKCSNVIDANNHLLCASK